MRTLLDGFRCIPYSYEIIDYWGNRNWRIIGAVMFRAVRISLPWLLNSGPAFWQTIGRAIVCAMPSGIVGNLPFHINAWVIVPDHMHAIWTLPHGDTDYSKRWGVIKKHFTQSWLASDGIEQTVTHARQNNRRRGIWQRRFWEHTLRDERDYAHHFDYLHFNPVKHGLVDKVIDWPYSSFHRCLNDGIYPENWGSKMESFVNIVGLECEGE